jgi:hypothetical protein
MNLHLELHSYDPGAMDTGCMFALPGLWLEVSHLLSHWRAFLIFSVECFSLYLISTPLFKFSIVQSHSQHHISDLSVKMYKPLKSSLLTKVQSSGSLGSNIHNLIVMLLLSREAEGPAR